MQCILIFLFLVLGELAVELEEDLRELLVLEEAERHWEDFGEGEVGGSAQNCWNLVFSGERFRVAGL